MTETSLPKRSKILVVDDTPANVLLLVRMLTERGYDPCPVLSGELALQSARAEPPDLILLDVTMPGMNGYEVCAHLKIDPALKDIPVIFISALSETIDKTKAFEAGGVDYVTKPFQFEEVEARIHTHLTLRRLQFLLEQQNLQLHQNYDQLRRLETLRDNLTNMVIHDMRSPLMVVSGSYEIIIAEQKTLSPTQREFADMGQAACHQLIEMATSLLDISRMEAGKMPLNRTPCDIRAIAQNAADSLTVLAREKTLTLDVTGVPAIAEADRDITGRIFVNLLGNAIKCSPSGGIITAEVCSNGETVRVTITDHGHGIPPEYQQKIFEKFGQVESRTENRKYSTGLGLTFCKLAVEAHGGHIGVESEVGKGSAFWFTLPQRTDDMPVPAPMEHS